MCIDITVFEFAFLKMKSSLLGRRGKDEEDRKNLNMKLNAFRICVDST